MHMRVRSQRGLLSVPPLQVYRRHESWRRRRQWWARQPPPPPRGQPPLDPHCHTHLDYGICCCRVSGLALIAIADPCRSRRSRSQRRWEGRGWGKVCSVCCDKTNTNARPPPVTPLSSFPLPCMECAGNTRQTVHGQTKCPIFRLMHRAEHAKTGPSPPSTPNTGPCPPPPPSLPASPLRSKNIP